MSPIFIYILNNYMNYDNLISNIFFPNHITKFSSKVYKKFIMNQNKYINICNYLINKYEHFNSYKESIFRIKYHINNIPKCCKCGKELQITFKPKMLYRTFCSRKCSNNDLNKIQQYKEFCLKEFGVTTIVQLPENRKKAQITFRSVESQKKRNKTLKNNNSYNKSSEEDQSYKLLKEKYPDIIRQYRSELYPFNCDFYIPSLNLYIECNYHWTHGGKLYEGTIEDNKLLQHWKDQNTKYYNNAIYTWTNLDIRKFNIMKENNLNYIIFYKLNELINWLNKNG